MKGTTRIATNEGNYIVAFPISYNEPCFFYVDRDMVIIKEATTSEWLWATTEWNATIERGEWNVPVKEWWAAQSILFKEKEEIVLRFFKDIPLSPEEESKVRIENWKHIDDNARVINSFIKYPLTTEDEYNVAYHKYITSSYKMYESIAALPNCEIVELGGDKFISNEYSGGKTPTDVLSYEGEFPVIVSTENQSYWRGGGSRATAKYYLLESRGVKPSPFLTVIAGDSFGTVKDCNLDFSFEEVYAATHKTK